MAMIYSLAGKKIYVAGHRGMVGSAIVRRLASENCTVLTATHDELDLCEQADVRSWMKQHRPQAIFLAAAVVGGINANRSYPVKFLHNNLSIAINVLEAARECNVEKLLFLGSSCVYPRETRQPIQEDMLLTGALEPTNQWYAIAKIAGLKLAEAYRLEHGCDFISCMPTNLYGQGDLYDLNNSHVLPAIIHKVHQAKMQGISTVTLWGSGKPKREFLYVDDMADACVHLMQYYSAAETINIGVGEDLSIAHLAELIAEIVGYHGQFVYDTTMPDGTMLKRLDVSRMQALGWHARIDLKTGIQLAYQDYVSRFV